MDNNILNDNRRVPIMKKGYNVPKPAQPVETVKVSKPKKGGKLKTLPLQRKQEATATGVRKLPKGVGTKVSRVKTATIAKPPEGRISNSEQIKVELLNETDEQRATNVMNKADNTDLDKLGENITTNTDQANGIPDTKIEIRKDIQEPRVAMKARKALEPRVAPGASIEAMNEYGKGVENYDRFSSLNNEPKVYPNKVHMDINDNDRNMNSELSKFGQFERNDNLLPENDRKADKQMAKVSIAGNKEYIRNDETQIEAKPIGAFDHQILHTFNNPHDVGINSHPQSSKLGGWYLK